jgi:hypothetical protein
LKLPTTQPKILTPAKFSQTAAAILSVIQQWLYEEGFDEAADSLDEEIFHAEESD